MSVFNFLFSLTLHLYTKVDKLRSGILHSFYLKLIVTVSLFMPFSKILAQYDNDEVLIHINDENISADDFIYFHKINDTEPLGNNKDRLIEQIDQFINIKLNVAEAEHKGYNRLTQFNNAFANYKKLLAESLFINDESFEKLSKEAYQRIKYQVRAKHIFIKLSKFASPEDTLIAYEKAMNIKRRLIDTEKFENVARETSDDPNAAIDGGDLWYIGAFITPYEVENYLFKGAKNTISEPIRTEKGYHIVKIIDRRRNPGRVKIAQIMIMLNKDADKQQEIRAKKRIDSLYLVALQTKDFAGLALKFSDDNSLVSSNGELAWFGTGEMPHEFEIAAFNLRKGEISKPFHTEYGWHIIKKTNQQKLEDYPLIKDQIRNCICKNDRYRICKQNIIKQMQSKYHFKENKELNILYTAVDSTIFEKKWRIPFLIDLDGDLFEIGNKKYTKNDFAKWLEKNQESILGASVEIYVDKQYEAFKNEKIIEFAINDLNKKNKLFRLQVAEFYDGMMLYSFMENEYWDVLKNDTTKLKQFYEKNLDRYNKKYSANISIFKYEEGTDVKKLKKYFEKYKKKALPDDQLTAKVSKSVKKDFILEKRFNAEEDENEVFDKIVSVYRKGNFDAKQSSFILESQKTLVYLNSSIKIVKKPWYFYKEMLVNDYQNDIYKQKVKSLRSKYNVSINEAVLERLYKVD